MRHADAQALVRKVTVRGQIVLPRELRESLGLEPGDRVEFVRTEDQTWTIRKAPSSFKKFIGALKAHRRLALDADGFLDEVRGSPLPGKKGER